MGEIEIREIEEKEIKGREEFFKQDDFLKRRINSLRDMLRSFGKKNEFYYSTMEENTNLMKEINDLRKEASIYLNKYNNLKYISKMEENKKKLKRILDSKKKKEIK